MFCRTATIKHKKVVDSTPLFVFYKFLYLLMLFVYIPYMRKVMPLIVFCLFSSISFCIRLMAHW